MSSTSSSTTATLNFGSGLPGSTPISISGLASGLDTGAIISELMAINSVQLDNTTLEQAGVQAQENELKTIQTSLQNLANDSVNLSNPSLFSTTQSASTSNPTILSASANAGAAIGGYEVTITQLATSAQRTFTYASPAGGDSVTIDGHTTQVGAGASIQDFVNAVNNDANATVYAAVTGSNTVVLSDRQTGDTGSNFIQVSDSGGTLTEQTNLAREGQNALWSVDGVNGSSSTNTVTNAIAGVSLTLTGLTTTTGPVTVNVAPPQASTAAINAAVTQFVNDYNATISLITTQLTTAPPFNVTAATEGQGTLYADTDLNALLTKMRQMMYSNMPGLSSTMQNLEQMGIVATKPSGSSDPSQAELEGNLTVNTTALDAAVTSNPSGVQDLLDTFTSQFTPLVDNEAGPGGSIDGRISSDTSQVSRLGNQISSMQYALAQQQTALEAEFANLESALSTTQAQGSELTSEIAQLPAG